MNEFEKINEFYRNNELLNSLIVIYQNCGQLHCEGWSNSDLKNEIILASLTKVLTTLLVRDTFKNKNLNKVKLVDYLGEEFQFLKDVTLEELITHTSKLPRNLEGISWKTGYDDFLWTNEFIIKNLKNVKLREENHFHYSNLGYALLTLVLEKVKNKKYIEILNNYIKLKFNTEIVFKPIFLDTQAVDNYFIGAGGIIASSELISLLINMLQTDFLNLSKLGFDLYEEDIWGKTGRLNYSRANLFISKNKILFISSNSDFIPDEIYDFYFKNSYKLPEKTNTLDNLLNSLLGSFKEERSGNCIWIEKINNDFNIITKTNYKLRLVEFNNLLMIASLNNCKLRIQSSNEFHVYENDQLVEIYKRTN